MSKSLVEMCTDIVSAQAGHTTMSSEDIVESLRRVFRTLQEVQQLGGTEEGEEGMSRDPGTSIPAIKCSAWSAGRPSNSSRIATWLCTTSRPEPTSKNMVFV